MCAWLLECLRTIALDADYSSEGSPRRIKSTHTPLNGHPYWQPSVFRSRTPIIEMTNQPVPSRKRRLPLRDEKLGYNSQLVNIRVPRGVVAAFVNRLSKRVPLRPSGYRLVNQVPLNVRNAWHRTSEYVGFDTRIHEPMPTNLAHTKAKHGKFKN